MSIINIIVELNGRFGVKLLLSNDSIDEIADETDILDRFVHYRHVVFSRNYPNLAISYYLNGILYLHNSTE